MIDSKKLSLKDKYSCLAADRVMRDLGLPVSVTRIDNLALGAFASQWKPFVGGLHGAGFEWDVFTQIAYYQEMENRFEAAIWDGDDLIALGIGEADLEKNYVARDFNERAPTEAGAKFKGLVVPMMNICLEEWAKCVGVEHICIFDPNLPSAQRLELEGFRYVSSLEVLGLQLGPAFYSYCTRPVIVGAKPLDFIYSPVDLEELGQPNDPHQVCSDNLTIDAQIVMSARKIAVELGLPVAT